jgi:hypothetical protein
LLRVAGSAALRDISPTTFRRNVLNYVIAWGK